MSCTECQKRMHFNSNGLEPKGRGGGRRAGSSQRGRRCQERLSHQKGLPFAGTDREVHTQSLSQFPEASVGSRRCPESLVLGFIFQMYSFIQKPVVHSYCISRPRSHALLPSRFRMEIATSPHSLSSVILAIQVSPWRCPHGFGLTQL